MLRKQGMKRSMARFDIVGQLGSLRRYARSLTRDSTDAEDLVHDALVRAYERRATFRSGGNLRAWLLAIVHNVFIDRMRSRRSEAARIEQAGLVADQSVPASQDHSVRLSQDRQARRAVRRASSGPTSRAPRCARWRRARRRKPSRISGSWETINDRHCRPRNRCRSRRLCRRPAGCRPP
ncbi:MAG: sigma-70 family RNA polymerase sigma factor, partial [Mesorhizobium sp.]